MGHCSVNAHDSQLFKCFFPWLVSNRMIYFRTALCCSPESTYRSEWPWSAPPRMGPQEVHSIPPPVWAILKGLPALTPSPGWIWNVWHGHVSSPISCFFSTRFLGPGLQWMGSAPSTWLCLPCSDLVGWCPTARVAICVGVTFSSPSLGKQTITFSPGFIFFLLRYYFRNHQRT